MPELDPASLAPDNSARWVLIGTALVISVVFVWVTSNRETATVNGPIQSGSFTNPAPPAVSIPAIQTTPRTAREPGDPKEQILKTVRKNFVDGLRAAFRNAGVDASISDIHGELIIIGDGLKLKPDRDEMARRLFGPTVRKNMCTMGFKTFALESGVIFGDGDTYSLGCPETTGEKEARLADQRLAREKYVNDLRGKLDSNMQVQDQSNELVLTSEAANDLSPAMIRANWGAMFTGQTGKNLCSIGFRGLRVRGTVNTTSTFISFCACPLD